MVITSLGFGGADTQVVTLARMLRARGWRVDVVSLCAPEAHVETLAAVGIGVHSLEMRRGVPDPRALFRLARLIRRLQPDVVHSHMVHANLLSRLTRLLAPMPALVCTAHSTREQSQRGGPTWHKEWLYRLTDRLADRTTIICEAGFRHYARRKAAPAARLTVIPIGIDCEHFAPDAGSRERARRELGITEGQFTFLAVGRMVVQKDYPTLLRAAALLRDKPWTLLIGGGGPLGSQMEQLRQELSLAGKVRFLGAQKDIRSWYHAADAFVMSSRIEGMPVVLLEAAASGLPAIVTDAGGSGEVVVSGKTGFVVPIGNHYALSAAMNQVLNMPGTRREQFAAAARARATEEFEIGNIVSRWETIYESCLVKTASRRRVKRTPSLATASPGPPSLAAHASPRTNA